MAKQGDRDRANPRLCASDKLEAVMEAPIHQGRRSTTAPEGRIDDCKPNVPPQIVRKTLQSGASTADKTALWFARKSYEHMANESALPDAVVAPGARATARW
jgi:hypothetical protein